MPTPTDSDSWIQYDRDCRKCGHTVLWAGTKLVCMNPRCKYHKRYPKHRTKITRTLRRM